MGLTRKKYILDKKFQIGISLKAIILPLISTLAISGVLLYFAINNYELTNLNNSYINQIVGNQDTMIDLFLSNPTLNKPGNPLVQKGVKTFKENIGKLKKISKNSSTITENSSIVFYFLIIMTIFQTIIIFSLFIFFSHKISGPVHVMNKYLADIKDGKMPESRSLRKNDELKEFYDNLRHTIEHITKNK